MIVKRLAEWFRWPWFDAESRAVLKVQFPLVVALSVLLTVGYALQREWRAVAEAHHLHLLLLGWDGWAWMVWPLAAPAMLWLIRRYPLSRGNLRRNPLFLAGGSLLIYVVVANLRMLLRLFPNLWLPPSADLPAEFPNYTLSILVLMPVDFVTYSAFFCLTLAVDYYHRIRRRHEEALRLELRSSQLETDLAQAELSALRGQLHPHFIFNSFNAVATLVRQRRNDAAVEFIAQLSMLLRLAIDRTGKQELSLEDELDFVRRYLAVERIRFGTKLQVRDSIASDVLSSLVPNLLLQPLVENSIKHGISLRTNPGSIGLAARRAGNRLEIEVENDGPDVPSAERSPSTGIGLANTRARLEKFYHGDYRLDMTLRPDGGMRVYLSLPYRGSYPPKTP